MLGRSVYSEIKKTRIQLVARMLLETNLTISQVSYALGYSCPENLSQSFQREKGMSPQAYRTMHTATGHAAV
ncbi:MAG: helix-turn-helix domain-containing protein [Verrucomicrobiota bacterium]